MKRFRPVVFLLTLMLLVSCLSAAAFAEGEDFVVYTIREGDTLYSICEALGLNFFDNRVWIDEVNHIHNYELLAEGQTLILPTFNTKADPEKAEGLKAALEETPLSALVPGNVINNGPVQTTETASTTNGGQTGTPLLEGDKIVCYLVEHVMQTGETVFDVCNAMGVDYAANADRIQKLSGITSWNRVAAGQTVIIPTTKLPSDSKYTAIVEHKVVAGDTAAIICRNYGLVYEDLIDELKILNNTQNLNIVNGVFYIPVKNAIGAGPEEQGTTSGQTAQTQTPAAVTAPQAGGTGTSAHGSFTLQINGVTVSTASVGQRVTIVASPEEGYKVGSVSVLKNNGTETVPVENMSFVMPNSPITVNVSFVKE